MPVSRRRRPVRPRPRFALFAVLFAHAHYRHAASTRSLAQPPLVEVVFGAGRLGIKIHSEDGLAPVRVKAFIPERESGAAPPVQRCGLVAVGDMILSVGSISVIGKDYSSVLRAIRTHPRPLTIRFGDAVSAATSGESARVDLTQGMDPVATFSPLSAYRRCLESGTIDLAELRRLSFQGCPEERRSTVWQLLLNYLPADPSQWPDVRTKMRALYAGYKRDFLVGPPPLLGGMELLELTTPPLPEASAHHQEEGEQLMADLVAKSAAHATRMLSGGADDGSDAEAASAGARSRTLAGDGAEGDADEVAARARRASGTEGDYMRAPAWFRESPRLRFFPSVVPGQQEERDGSADATIESVGAQLMWRNFYVESSAMAEIEKDVLRTHPGLHFFNRSTQQRLGDMLYVYAKLNPGISYVQGMNELLAPLYYVIAQALGEGREDEAEADTFYCFTNLMSEVRSLYVKDMDKEEKGIYGSMRSLTALINEIDSEVGEHLDAIGVSPEFYAFRWLTTLGSREFDLPVSERSAPAARGARTRARALSTCALTRAPPAPRARLAVVYVSPGCSAAMGHALRRSATLRKCERLPLLFRSLHDHAAAREYAEG